MPPASLGPARLSSGGMRRSSRPSGNRSGNSPFSARRGRSRGAAAQVRSTSWPYGRRSTLRDDSPPPEQACPRCDSQSAPPDERAENSRGDPEQRLAFAGGPGPPHGNQPPDRLQAGPFADYRSAARRGRRCWPCARPAGQSAPVGDRRGPYLERGRRYPGMLHCGHGLGWAAPGRPDPPLSHSREL